jgi:choline dehydrogenase-like flavoprotein
MSEIYDAVVVGSGAAGGMAATELCLKGLKVLLLEAGPKLDLVNDFQHHKKPYQFPFRGRIRPSEQAKYNYVVNEWNKPSFINELEHPYTGKKFAWVRARCGRQDASLGTGGAPFQRARFSGCELRRVRRELAHHLR